MYYNYKISRLNSNYFKFLLYFYRCSLNYYKINEYNNTILYFHLLDSISRYILNNNYKKYIIVNKRIFSKTNSCPIQYYIPNKEFIYSIKNRNINIILYIKYKKNNLHLLTNNIHKLYYFFNICLN
jgi:hypothetical protein